jgi:hypothetical protein
MVHRLSIYYIIKSIISENSYNLKPTANYSNYNPKIVTNALTAKVVQNVNVVTNVKIVTNALIVRTVQGYEKSKHYSYCCNCKDYETKDCMQCENRMDNQNINND